MDTSESKCFRHITSIHHVKDSFLIYSKERRDTKDLILFFILIEKHKCLLLKQFRTMLISDKIRLLERNTRQAQDPFRTECTSSKSVGIIDGWRRFIIGDMTGSGRLEGDNIGILFT